MKTEKRLFIFVILISLAFGNAPFAHAAARTELPAGVRRGERKVFYYLHDHLGGISAVTDEDGNVVERRDYLPFGSDRLAPDAQYGDYGFTGKEQDPETELYYYGARYYDPMIGRFISQDPWEGDLTDQQTWNKYSYARNNPVKYIDPTGKTFIDNYIWTLGVKYLDYKGFKIAAEFLNYSVNWNQVTPFQGASEKKGLYFNTNSNDKLAKTIGSEIRNTRAYGQIIGEIEKSIQSGNLNSEGKTLSSSFSKEDNPDLFLAMNKFNYSYEVERLEDSSYNVTISITDTYDFDWVKSKNLTDVVNNMAVNSQSIDAIQTYEIKIDLQETIRSDEEKKNEDGD